MSIHARRICALSFVSLFALFTFARPVRAQTEASLSDLLAGSAVPHSIKLKELTSEWRRVNIGSEMTLGMGSIMQSMMQAVGSMFGGTGSDALYTRGATLKIGGEQFLVGYRLPSQGLDFGALMAMGPGALGGGPPGAKPKMPERKPITPESELSVTLINLRAIGSISDIHPFDMPEAMKPPPPGFLDMLEKSKEKAEGGAATSNLKQVALAVMMYAQDYDEMLPPMTDAVKFRKVILPYLKNNAAFTSPATGKPFRPNPRLSGRKLASLGSASGVVMLYSAVPEPDGSRLIARADGSVRTVAAADWPKLAAAQKLPPN